jgi:hypothetical protein
MKSLFRILVIMTFISSCTQDSYEKGEGKYSLMRGDFVDAYVNASKQIVSFVTDDGDQLPSVAPYSAKWIAKGDTIYRCMLYYNKVETERKQYAAEIVSIGQVPCAKVKRFSEFDKEFRTDPVKFESMWLSKSEKYLNLYFQLKTGETEDTSAVQQLAFLTDTVMAYPNGFRTHRLLLHHDQNNVPEYYSTKAYVSVPIEALDADSVSLSVNTYDGLRLKTIPLHR